MYFYNYLHRSIYQRLGSIVIPFYVTPNSAQLQIYNNTEATIDKIWKTVENVWNETSSSEVARAFVLAYRVMDVIIKEDGNNDFLKWNPTLQCSQGL
jgi:hypothetical protein